MYEPYPGSTQLPETTRPPVPASVRNAVRVMYVGAVTSVLGIAIDIVTINTTKHALVIGFWVILVWLVGLAATILLWRRSSTAFFRADREPA